MGIFKKINFGLRKTRNNVSGAIDNVLDSYTSIDEQLFDDLEEALVMGDVGVATASEITLRLNDRVRKKKLTDPADVKAEIKEIVSEMLEGGEDMGLVTVPSIILVIGVNGVGKTTTIGKMAAMYKAQGKSVILAAADTFRAAAIDQLDVWAERAGVDIIKHSEGADPGAAIYDTIAAAKARGSEIIICDTAGRLHNKKNLMDELAKIYRIIDRELPYSDREVLLVLDATTGQNAVNQAREFAKIAEITGIILTKLDGTARGGVVLAIKNELKVPVKFIGVGEGLDDLQPFNPIAFANGLFESLPEDFEEDEIDLSKIREDIPVSADGEGGYTTEELKEAVAEIFGALAEINEEESEEGGEAAAAEEAEPSEETAAEEEPAADEIEAAADVEAENDSVKEGEALVEENIEADEEAYKEAAEDSAQPVDVVAEEAAAQAEEITETVSDGEKTEEVSADDSAAAEPGQEEPKQEEPKKKKKGFFGRLFG